MPRVSLKTLKQKKKGIEEEETDDPPEAADTMVGIMAKIIQDAHRRRGNAPQRPRGPLGGDIEHDNVDPDKNQTNIIDSDENISEGAMALECTEMPCDAELDMLSRKVKEYFMGDLHLNIDQEEMDTMKTLIVFCP